MDSANQVMNQHFESSAAAFNPVRLSQLPQTRRAELLRRYERDVYGPAFPDASIREDPQYWARLLDADPYPAPPQPLIDVAMLVDGHDCPIGGATIEYYRGAKCGLLTYLSVAERERGQGHGRELAMLARRILDEMAEADTPMLAETERLEDAANPQEAAETEKRQRRLSALGARWIDFDYVMPPLRADSQPHRLHLLVFDPDRKLTSIEAGRVAVLIRELAAALGADLDAHEETRAMMDHLASMRLLPITSLPAIASA
ncbi:GNAT superfamily N-acetyltransferase [Altererythrobacter atlanticus]|uniref:Uncharacterized protein n=1 Tax=Croceibacterium atlanticum TaxID=1267766 RepID=A0A0F7KQF3_9SPHN|nr:GNAT family N-acetyltransferase [Croceibacterium atlanticum]AKH41804.1 hypothetical protein WYH_00750 [Croceibacterium atlanticum]MBB5733270.1 GNAT superfamily N-acetyltransferase [Croceibacterium atlanticum]